MSLMFTMLFATTHDLGTCKKSKVRDVQPGFSLNSIEAMFPSNTYGDDDGLVNQRNAAPIEYQASASFIVLSFKVRPPQYERDSSPCHLVADSALTACSSRVKAASEIHPPKYGFITHSVPCSF